LAVTASELKRWLANRGCTFEEGKKHTKIVRGRSFSFMPRHPKKEIKEGTLRSILKALDLRM
jgi:mRNA interferase HicA